MDTLQIHGTRVPRIGLGTWLTTGDDAKNAVAHALSVGYRHIDTAQVYENESDVGEAIHASGISRGDIWLTTKVWYENLRFQDVLSSTDVSLRKLRTDYVDLLLIHWPNPEVELEESLSALSRIRESGKARFIGVSNFPADLLLEALQFVPDLLTNQVEYHPFLGQQELLNAVRSNEMFLTAYSPLARRRVAKDETIQTVAAAHGRSVYQIVLRWHLQQDAVVAIPKSKTPEYIEANLDVFDFELTADEMAAISDLARAQRIIDPDFAPTW
ncbi:aldo/keto reductase [soil metagenome]